MLIDKYLDLLDALLRLRDKNKGLESLEEDDLLEQMDVAWQMLDDQERDTVNKLPARSKIMRKWMYVQKPADYSIACDKCGSTNLDWSEYQGYVYCYTCKRDVRGDKGIFDGPVPVDTARILGMSFDIIDIETKQIIKFDDYRNGNNKRYNELCS